MKEGYFKSLNDAWKFKIGNHKYLHQNDFEMVSLPHRGIQNDHTYSIEKNYQIELTYEREINIDKYEKNFIYLVKFEGVAHSAKIYLNGEFVLENKGGYLPFSVDISNHLKENLKVLLTVVVNGCENQNIPPFGGVIDYLTYVGIYRDVLLEVKPKFYVKDVYFKQNNLLKSGFIEVFTDVSGIDGILTIELIDKKTIFKESLLVKNNNCAFKVPRYIIELWNIDNPKLYLLKITYEFENTVHIWEDYVGFRTCEFTTHGFYLNGERIKLIGLNRHQSYPYIGYAADDNLQYEDAYILKHKLGVNIVRTAHYPQSKAFLKACDELGLLVFEEIPGWQHLGNEEWKNLVKENVEGMIKRDRRHPSIVIWGVRVNESFDESNLYKSTNQIARSLDERQTTGVRYLKQSELLEDVYSYNDFSYQPHKPIDLVEDVTPNLNKPYLITEHTGHMYPVKVTDPEPNHIEQCRRHLDIINAAFGDDRISGVIGWDMFDYQTHLDFGAGDGICHHGVLDIHRNFKHAGYVYASQQDKYPVLHIVNQLQNGDYPGGVSKEILILTNLDYIKVYRNDEYIDTLYPNSKEYPNLKHAPIFIPDLMGNQLVEKEGYTKEESDKLISIYRNAIKGLPIEHLIDEKIRPEVAWGLYGKYISNWGSRSVQYRFEGYKDEKVVLSQTKAAFNKLELCIEKPFNLKKDKEVMVRIPVFIKDQNGNICRYLNEPINIQINDGENYSYESQSIVGGQTALWIKMKPNKTQIKVKWRSIEKQIDLRG